MNIICITFFYRMLEVEHPAAKVLVELAQLQDEEVGDGTTSVVIIAAELLKVLYCSILGLINKTAHLKSFATIRMSDPGMMILSIS